jgi:hypothetical protein
MISIEKSLSCWEYGAFCAIQQSKLYLGKGSTYIVRNSFESTLIFEHF